MPILQYQCSFMTRTALAFAFVFANGLVAGAQRNTAAQNSIAEYLRRETESGSVVGAQVLVGSLNGLGQGSVNLGVISPEDSRPVSDATLFCVASCSKPVASAVIFSLLDRRQMRLDLPAGELIPTLKSPTTENGLKTPSPTLRQLLAHRGGIYSQMKQPSDEQMKAIRDFRLSLEESAKIIAAQPLFSRPGSKYAYSGAGYVLVGRMAEQATGKEFETLLQANICEPLQMTSTTYFPHAKAFAEIAGGGATQLVPPHMLSEELKLPLIGGSLYSTAKDFETFAKMVLLQGRWGRNRVFSELAWRHFVFSAYPNQMYGYGWRLTKQRGRVVSLSHNGSLPPYQSAIRVDLQRRAYQIVFWTLAKPADVQATKRIRNKVDSLLGLKG